MTEIQELFSGKKRYRVPRYQRRYVWSKENWEALWRDLIQLQNRKHFTGSIITKSDDDDSGDIIIIDGQQRLITFQIIFRLIHDLWKSGKYTPSKWNGETFQKSIYEVEGYTQHHEIGGYRILITKEDDRKAFKSVISGNCWKENIEASSLSFEEAFKSLYDSGFMDKDKIELSEEQNPIETAYGYFGWEITKRLDEDPDKSDQLIQNLKYQFHVNSANLESDDDPQQAFGSSNGTGVPLDEFDLLRNDLFLRVKDLDTQDVLYNEHWKTFDDNPFWKGGKPDKFLEDFLMAKLGPKDFNPENFKGGRVFHDVYKGLYHEKLEQQLENKLKDLYYIQEQKQLKKLLSHKNKNIDDHLGKKEFVEFVELKKYAETYQRMEDPNTNIGRRRQFYTDLKSIFKNLDLTSFPPFLLYLENELSEDKRDEVFKILESYVMRCQFRGAINEDQTTRQKIDTWFIKTVDDKDEDVNVKDHKFAKTFAEYLASKAPGRKWRNPKDGLRQAAYQIKYNSVAAEYVWKMFRYIFYRIEGEKRQNNNFMSFDTFIESFPCKVFLRPMYRGQEPTISYNIGNITFGSESVPQHFSPIEKRKLLLQNNGAILELNREIEDVKTWNRTQIEARKGKLLRYFDKIWPPPEQFVKQKLEANTTTSQISKIIPSWVSMIEFPCIVMSYEEPRELLEINTLDKNTLFVCSLKSWQELEPSIEIVDDVRRKQLKPPQQSEQLNIKDEFLKSAREKKADVSLVTRSGHLLEGTIEDIYKDAICMEIREHRVIVFKTGLLEFATDILYEGFVKDWRQDDLFGSIKCESTSDILQEIKVKSEFIDQSILSQKLLPNVKVTFNLNIVQENGKSHFQARDVEPITTSDLHQGRIKWFEPTKGSGFITPNNYREEEIYINKSQVLPKDLHLLLENQLVEFNIAETTEGHSSVAINVKVVQ